MIKALKEYNEMVWKPSWKWVKKHWKGYSVFLVIYTVVLCLYYYIQWRDI